MHHAPADADESVLLRRRDDHRPSALPDLDGSAEAALVKTLGSIVRPEDILIYATHKTALLAMATRVLVMRSGRIVHDGDRDSVGRAMQTPASFPAHASVNRVA